MTGLKYSPVKRATPKALSPMRKSSTARKLVGKSPLKSPMKSQKSLKTVQIIDKKPNRDE